VVPDAATDDARRSPRERLEPAASISAYIALTTLIVVSIIGILPTALAIVRQIKNQHGIIFVAALVTALIPFGCILFWGYKAIAAQVHHFYTVRDQYLTGHREGGRTLIRHSHESGPGVMPSPDRRKQRPGVGPFGLLIWRNGKAEAALWIAAAFCTALALVIGVLAATGVHEKAISTALRLTGRLSFLLFWPAYAGSATAALFGPRFARLVRHGREFGLAFASAQLVHVALVAWLIANSSEPVLLRIMPFFAIGVVWTYVLAFSSTKLLQNLFRPDLWQTLRNLGVEYIALVFFADLVLGPIQSGTARPIAYVPFALPLISGSLLRVAAMGRQRQWAPLTVS
jgi:hypothetical protein